MMPLVTCPHLDYYQVVKSHLLIAWEDETDWTGLICDYPSLAHQRKAVFGEVGIRGGLAPYLRSKF